MRLPSQASNETSSAILSRRLQYLHCKSLHARPPANPATLGGPPLSWLGAVRGRWRLQASHRDGGAAASRRRATVAALAARPSEAPRRPRAQTRECATAGHHVCTGVRTRLVPAEECADPAARRSCEYRSPLAAARTTPEDPLG